MSHWLHAISRSRTWHCWSGGFWRFWRVSESHGQRPACGPMLGLASVVSSSRFRKLQIRAARRHSYIRGDYFRMLARAPPRRPRGTLTFTPSTYGLASSLSSTRPRYVSGSCQCSTAHVRTHSSEQCDPPVGRLGRSTGPNTGSDADAFNGTLDTQKVRPTGTSATKGRPRDDSGRIIPTRTAAVKKKWGGEGGVLTGCSRPEPVSHSIMRSHVPSG